MTTSAASVDRPLRVALLWNSALLDERLLMTPTEVVLGTAPNVTFPMPDGVLDQERATLLAPTEGGYQLNPIAGMQGVLWLNGRRQSAQEVRQPLALGSGDYGLLSFGSTTVFFQHVRNVRGDVPRKAFRDGALIGCFGLSFFTHVVVLLFLWLVVAKEAAPAVALELDSALLTKMLVTPPPESPVQRARDEAGLRKVRQRDEAGAKRKRDKSTSQRQAASSQSEAGGSPASAVAQQVRTLGLLGALSGGQGTAQALQGPSLNSLLGSLGPAQNLAGGGGGMTLRGSGGRGNGSGTGVSYGAGALGTGIAGGKGLGRGAGGPGEGRGAAERTLSLDSKAARVSGFLSPEQINRVVQANRAAITYCFESALQQKPNLEGAVHVQWRIDRQGNVSSARIEKSTLGDTKVEGCLVRQIKRWRFPVPDGGEVEVVYPFGFRHRQ